VGRLLIITSEDVGLAWPEGPAVIGALYESWKELKRRRNGNRPKRLMVMHAACALTRAPKSRRMDEAVWATYGRPEWFEIPDEALDRHTQAGRDLLRKPPSHRPRSRGISQLGRLSMEGND
jgi:replication-associated recombination protein RarA